MTSYGTRRKFGLGTRADHRRNNASGEAAPRNTALMVGKFTNAEQSGDKPTRRSA
jgi:hypothetical protein